MAPFLIFLLLACSSRAFYNKWDHDVRSWYEGKVSGEAEFKVLLRNRECFESIKDRFRVLTETPSTVVVVRLSREELLKISEDRCVIYLEAPKPVHIKSFQISD